MYKTLKINHLIYRVCIFLCILLCYNCTFFKDENTTPSSLQNPKKSTDTQIVTRESVQGNLENIDSINNIATEEWRLGNYQKALDHIGIAYEKAENQEDKKVLAKVLNTLGLIHWSLANNEDAMACYQQANIIAQKENMYRLLGLTHTNQALIFKEEKSYDLALFHNNKAIDIFKEHQYFRELAIALNNQGQIFKKQEENETAKKYYLQALSNYNKAEYKDGASASYYNLSEVYMRQNNKEEALKTARKSFELSLEIESKVRISEAYRRISETYDHFNQSDSALKYFKKYNSQQLLILEANQSKTLAKQQAEMGAEVKNLQIQNLEKEQELANNKLWFIAILVGLCLLIIAFIVYRYLAHVKFRKRELEIELESSKKVLDVKEQELKAYIIDLSKRNSLINQLQKKVSKLTESKKESPAVLQLLDQKILTEEDWETFKSKFKSIYPGFFIRMKEFKTSLTEAEVRFMVLLRLDLSSKEMAKTLGISPQSVRACKMRLKKKLKKEGMNTVENFLIYLVK